MEEQVPAMRADIRPDDEEVERSYLGWIIAIGVLAAAAAIGFFFWQTKPIAVPVPVPRAEAPAPPTSPEPAIQHPLPQVSTEPLPPLESSDTLMSESLATLLGKPAVAEWVLTDGVVRRIVATVDNLPREKVATRILPVRTLTSPFVVAGQGDELAIGAGNAARYARHVRAAQSIDPKAAAALYVRLYPLFQRAYEDLGYPNGYFNDRLIEVIDHLLAAPEARGPLKLVQPKVRYVFADPNREALSAGQKVMLRIGADNAAAVKRVLRDFRGEIAAMPPKQ